MPDSALVQAQTEAGARGQGCPGGPPHAHFGDVAGEYHAARQQAALFDLTNRTQLEITGEDRVKFLHNFCTQEIRARKVGESCEAFVCNVQGKVLGHIFVHVAPHALWIDTVADAGPALLKHFEKYHISEDVTFTDRSAERGTLLVCGPHAANSLDSLQIPVAGWGPAAHGVVSWREIELWVRRCDWLGVPGWQVVAPRGCLAELWTALREGRVRPAGSSAWEALRLEASFPTLGVDFTADNLAPEVNRVKEGISYTKGCYLGQEPIARIDALGHVNRCLRGIRCESGEVPAAGTEIFVPGALDRPIGKVTSAAFSPGTQSPVARAWLKRGSDTPGFAVLISGAGAALSGTVF